MRKISKKYQERLKKKKETYAKFDEENDGICKGCGRFLPGSHSHLIPISESKDLESVVENITWHCIETCHSRWESHNIEEMSKMLDFEDNMSYIQKVKPLYYNRLINK
jgi:hypothetical protein